MNAFFKHHRDNFRFGYCCFDRIVLTSPNAAFSAAGAGGRVFREVQRSASRRPEECLAILLISFHNWIKDRAECEVECIVFHPSRRARRIRAPIEEKIVQLDNRVISGQLTPGTKYRIDKLLTVTGRKVPNSNYQIPTTKYRPYCAPSAFSRSNVTRSPLMRTMLWLISSWPVRSYFA